MHVCFLLGSRSYGSSGNETQKKHSNSVKYSYINDTWKMERDTCHENKLYETFFTKRQIIFCFTNCKWPDSLYKVSFGSYKIHTKNDNYIKIRILAL